MLTPFQDNGNVDYDRLTGLIEFYLEAGAAGLFANCQSSEMYLLNDQERMSVLEHVLKTVDGAVPVVATGAFGGNIDEQAASIKKMADTGIRAAIIITCLIAREQEDKRVFDERIFRLLELTGEIPLGFYECPQPYKRVLDAEQLGRFASTGRVIYHKDTCLDIELVRKKLAAAEGTGLGLYDAYMVNAVASLKAGARGLSCIQGNYFPELIVWLCEHYDRPGSAAMVDKVQRFLTSNMEIMHQAYPLTAKYFLMRRGLLKNTFSREACPGFDKSLQAGIDNLFDTYIKLREEIGLSPRS